MAERVERSYLFSVGNSSDGPIGFVARVSAVTREEAVNRLRSLLPGLVECDHLVDGLPFDGKAEYLTVYFNDMDETRGISVKDIEGAECLGCEAEIAEDEDRCPYEDEHPEDD
jgi:hypothetical protein